MSGIPIRLRDEIQLSIYESEINGLKKNNDAMTLFFTCLSFIISCGLNLFNLYENMNSPSFIYNGIVCVSCFFGAIFFARAWYLAYKEKRELVNKILSAPISYVSKTSSNNPNEITSSAIGYVAFDEE